MKTGTAIHAFAAAMLSLVLATGFRCAARPLELTGSIALSGVRHFEHFAADPDGGRLFCLAGVNSAAVEVFDLRTHAHIHSITGLLEGQCCLFRKDQNRLYIVGGGGNLIAGQPGKIWIYDGKNYSLIKILEVPPGPAWSGYDEVTKLLYVNGNGRLVKNPFSTVTVIDTGAGEKVAQFRIDDDVITDFQLEASNPKMYVGERNRKAIAVVDRSTRKVIAAWPVTLGEGLGHMALDCARHRLFVSCRYGQIVVFDTESGRELQAFPVNQYTDDLQYDPGSRRLYATCGGPVGLGRSSVDVIQQTSSDRYDSLGRIFTEPGARNGILVPESNEFFVSVPEHAGTESHLLVFAVK